MEVSDKIALGALAISMGSLLLAFFSYLSSRRALKLSEQEVSERKLPIISYLIDCFVFYNGDEKFCSFAISYTNQSSSPRTFSSLILEAEFVDNEGVSGKAISEPSLEVEPPGLSYGYKKLEIPINLPPKETVTGWISFKLPKGEDRAFHINSYRVVGRSPDGGEAELYAFLMRLVRNETQDEDG
ncbi:DUF4352 domain-containing protein [Marinobacter shengliensis]|uniref:DUF4352 domain-containing protein n=1 Tax=Marinobacter TaxID=2742 RepID=UPI001E2E3832|nr:DUF4352 domain-containing protein [Marinobacter shengliensis]MCD1632116.1 DUF4352 domain-containing protein [Marinobacter shengliensis]